MSTRPKADTDERPDFIKALAIFAIFGCAVFAVSILIADFVVPNHDWVADTISDLGAGRYEFIVDIGIYAFSASFLALALLAAHSHLGGWAWSGGIVGLAILALVIFLVGARNEYGDNDSEGVVIHVYLVYALGVLIAVTPLLLAAGAKTIANSHQQALIGFSAVWAVSAPIFFMLPNSIDGIYERYLGLLAFLLVVVLVRLFLHRAKTLSGEQSQREPQNATNAKQSAAAARA